MVGQGKLVRGWARAFGGIALALALASCGTLSRNALPESAALGEVVAAPGPVRFWGDAVPPDMETLTRQRLAQYRAAGIDPSGTMSYLAVSGGGSDGAFGAGLLVGWSEAGTRPRFDVVTGISTGALIAPLAFLGRDYDPQLREVYTAYGLTDLVQRRTLVAA